MNKAYDISITISPDMTTWPGDPAVVIERAQKLEEGAMANVSRMDIGVHTGTHIDAPYHFISKGKTVDQIPLDTLIGRARVVEVSVTTDRITDSLISELMGEESSERLLFKTRNSQILNKRLPFDENFSALDREGARYLVDNGVKLIGIDYLSAAPFDDVEEVHQILLAGGIVILEGLDLSSVNTGLYDMVCLPLKLEGIEGSPSRVVLFEI